MGETAKLLGTHDAAACFTCELERGLERKSRECCIPTSHITCLHAPQQPCKGPARRACMMVSVLADSASCRPQKPHVVACSSLQSPVALLSWCTVDSTFSSFQCTGLILHVRALTHPHIPMYCLITTHASKCAMSALLAASHPHPHAPATQHVMTH